LWLRSCGSIARRPLSCQRAEQQHGTGEALDHETHFALAGVGHIAARIEQAADHPHDAEPGGHQIAPVDREQPQRGQEDRQPLQGVGLHPDGALQHRIARHGGRMDAGLAPRPADREGEAEVEQKRKEGDDGHPAVRLHVKSPSAEQAPP
jgi:hypothetical protein